MPDLEDEEEALLPTGASIAIQRVWRGRCARRRSGNIAQGVFEKILDPTNQLHYYYNTRLDKSRWTRPLFLELCGRDIDRVSPVYSPLDAAIILQRFWRLKYRDDDESDGVSNDSPTIAPRNFPRSMVQHLVDDAEDCSGNVVCLNLSGLSLSRISSRIYDLGDKITRANLSRNRLGRISPDIADLYRLCELDISKNSITRLPKEICDLCHLKTLNMSNNLLESYPTTLYKLQHLVDWDISHNRLTAVHTEEGNLELLNDTKEWEVGIGLLVSLRFFRASHNKIKLFPKQIERCTDMTLLDMSFNCIEDIPKEAGLLQKLEKVLLKGNKIPALPQSCGGKWRMLEELQLGQNGVNKLPRILSAWKSLKIINLDRCTMNEVPNAVIDLNQVQKLTLSQNSLRRVSQNIGSMRKLRMLTVANNRLSDMPPSLGDCRQLASLSLASNCFKTVPRGVFQLFKLTNLDISRNSIASLQGLGSLVSLTSLNASANSFDELSVDIFRLDKLTHLDLSFNRLATLPGEISRLQMLEDLRVSHNGISAIPAELSSLPLIRTLDLSHNNLEELPDELAQLKRLEKLSLGNNCFSSRPTIFTSCIPALHFNLENNPVSGLATKCDKFHGVAAEVNETLSKLCRTNPEGYRDDDFLQKASHAVQLAHHLQIDSETTPLATQYFRLGVAKMMVAKLLFSPQKQQQNGGDEEKENMIARGDEITDGMKLDAHKWFREAIRYFTLAEEALASKRNRIGKGAEVYYNRAICCYELKDYAAALQDVSVALSVNPDHIPTHELRSKIRVELGQLPASTRDINIGLKKAPCTHHDTLSELQELSNENMAACTLFNKGELERTFYLSNDGVLRRSRVALGGHNARTKKRTPKAKSKKTKMKCEKALTLAIERAEVSKRKLQEAKEMRLKVAAERVEEEERMKAQGIRI